MGVIGGAVGITKKVLTNDILQTAVGTGLNVAGSINEYKGSVREGDSKLTAFTKTAANFVFTDMMGLYAIPYMAVQTAVPMLVAAGKHSTDTIQNAYLQRGKLGSGHFNMSQAGYTMRQRSLNAIRSNGLNLNSALGNEARTYFRSSI